MKQLIIAMALLMLTTTIQAQKKTTGKEKPPTQKEMQQMMKEAQGMLGEMMKEMSPEDKKTMDSLGIKMPDMKNASKIISSVSNKQLATAWEDENRIVPKKDVARIAAIPKGLTSARMQSYIALVHKKYMEKLAPETIDAGQKLYDLFNAKGINAADKGLLASMLWIDGKPQLALLLMGKSCTAEVNNTDNLANYAAMLSMQGGQHLAIPILQRLNGRFPKNSSLLNNLGQAWFGLGDMGKASIYLDSAMAIYPLHPQANLTKALIQESKGDQKGALESLKKSVKHAYTQEKEEKLRKLGYQLTRKDLRVPFKPGSDPMGVGKTRRPDYPLSVAQAHALIPLWQQFNNACEERIKKLQKELGELNGKYAKALNNMATQSMAAIQKGGAVPSYRLTPLFLKKASLLASQQKAYHEQRIVKLKELFTAFNLDVATIRKNHPQAVPEAPCATHLQRANALLAELNNRKKSYDEQVLKIYTQFYNDMAYWAMYTSTNQEMFDMICIEFEIHWLQKNRELQPLDMNSYGGLPPCANPEEAQPGKLAEFDDIACNYKSTVDLGLIKIETNCNYTTTTYDLNMVKFIEKERGLTYIGGTVKLTPELKGGGNIGPVEVEASLGADVNIHLDEKNNITNWDGTVKAGVEGGIDTKVGPVDIGATASQTIEMEIGSNGIGDVNATSTAEVSAGVAGQKISAGSEKRVSLISGHGTRSGTGILSGITFSSW